MIAPPIAITPGEPSGIGPDICIMLVQSLQAGSPLPVFIADPELLGERADMLGIPIDIQLIDEERASSGSSPLMRVIPVKLAEPVRCGVLNPANAAYVLDTLDRAAQGCLNGEFSALVTGPVQKSVINEAGIAFTGHTEYLADYCKQGTVVMMLASAKLRVALVTTHLPLAEVPRAISRELLLKVIDILYRELQNRFGIKRPHILVTGLNPHAGEGGHLGREEIDVIEPVLAAYREKGMNLEGPLPADTLFTEKYLKKADAVLAMYHDQGLPVLKHQGFGEAVNITLGLPFVRTSVDHGTALDLAGTGKAGFGSLKAAFDQAVLMSG